MTNPPPVRSNRSYTTLAAAIIIAAVVIVAAIFATVGSSATVTTTKTSTATATSTQTAISTTTVTVTSTHSENAFLSACSQTPSPGANAFPKLVVSMNATALLCIRVYYYNYNGTYTLNVTKALDIEAAQYSPSARVFSGASNFTVLTSPNELVIGGPNSTNEGAVIAYALTAKPGASGSYELNFNSVSYVINTNGPEACGDYGEIVAGTGEPSYLITGFSGCITYRTNVTTNSTKYTKAPIAGPDAFGPTTLINGDIYFIIPGFTNSTQIGAIG